MTKQNLYLFYRHIEILCLPCLVEYVRYFRGITENNTYSNLIIEKCIITSSLRDAYECDWAPVIYDFDVSGFEKQKIYPAVPKHWEKYPIELDVEANEIITVTVFFKLKVSCVARVKTFLW